MKRYDALTPAAKAIVVDYFCRAQNYDTLALEGEGKLEFFQRICNEWPVAVALKQRRLEVAAAAALQGESDADLTLAT